MHLALAVAWHLAHLAGYGAGGYLGWQLWQPRRARNKARAYEALQARIARLEIASGVGLDYGLEWVLSRPIACSPGMEKLAKEYNGFVERKCWCCEVTYLPAKDYANFHDPGAEHELSSRLCGVCWNLAKAELDRL